jgi:hypothetical protein
MARPIKDGWDYFPMDTNLDNKFRAVEAVFKNDGFVWIVKFWQEAYSSNDGCVDLRGYHRVIHAENCRITTEQSDEIAKLCLEIEIIKEISPGIYSSNGIQKRIKHLLSERERWRNKRESKLSPLLSPEITHEIRGESKVKESKEKYIVQQTFDFESIWLKYPRRVGRKMAEKHFEASVKTKKDFEDLSKALANYLSSKRVAEGFVQNGATWFNNWRDWIDYKEEMCKKCKDKGSFQSATGYTILCECPAGKRK